MITITHKITSKKIATTLRMSGHAPMTKTWHRQKDGSFMLDNCNTWEDEGFSDNLAYELDRAPTNLCNCLESE